MKLQSYHKIRFKNNKNIKYLNNNLNETDIIMTNDEKEEKQVTLQTVLNVCALEAVQSAKD